MAEDERPQPSEWSLHWKVLLAATAGVTLLTVTSYTPGVMIGPLEREFGWTRAQISTGPMILALMALVAGPAAGVAIDRLGPRRIGLFGILAFCAAIALLSTAGPELSSWLMMWVLVSFAAIFIMPTTWTAAVSSLFTKNRGLALAIMLCGTGLGAAVIPMLTHALVERYGWRGGYIGIGLLGAAIVFPLAYFFLTSAVDARRSSGAATRPNELAPALSGVTVRQGFASPRFYKLAAAATLVSTSTGAVIPTAVPILTSEGFAAGSAAQIAGLIGVGSIVGRLCGGYLLDRLNGNIVAGVSVLGPAVGCGLLLAVPGSAPVAVAAFLIMGLGVGTELDAVAYLASRHLGLLSFGSLFGTMSGVMIFGNSLAPMAANLAYDITRSYHLVLLAVIPAFLTATLLFFLLGPYPAFED